MEIDPLEIANSENHEDSAAKQEQNGKLNNYVAISVALLATFLGICNVKAGNITQAMQQTQADKVDYWAWYQARNIREEIAQATVVQLQTQAIAQNPQVRASYDKQIAAYQQIAKSQGEKKEELSKKAEELQKTYEQLNVHDDQFDLSEASISLAIALYALTSLLQKRWLFMLALVPTSFGIFMGLAGLLSWNIHIEGLTKLLSQNSPQQQLNASISTARSPIVKSITLQ